MFDKLDTAKMHGLDTSTCRVVSRLDVTSHVESGLKQVSQFVQCIVLKHR